MAFKDPPAGHLNTPFSPLPLAALKDILSKADLPPSKSCLEACSPSEKPPVVAADCQSPCCTHTLPQAPVSLCRSCGKAESEPQFDDFYRCSIRGLVCESDFSF